jgi:DNA polymerase alpha subunit B
MAEADTLNELTTLFARPPGTTLEPEITAELQSIMRLHHLSPQDLFFKWESYCIKMDRDDLAPSLDMIRGLKQDIQDALERFNRAHQKAGKGTGMGVANGIGATPRTGVKGGDVGGM